MGYTSYDDRFVMDRRKKINVNRYESLADTELRQAVKEFGARVCPKVRIADTLQISRSGLSNEEFQYALKSHFDFVVVDENEQVEFAVEFDGPHHDSDPDAIRRERLGMPLLRINYEHLEEVGFESPSQNRSSPFAGRFSSLINWLVELWFLKVKFYEAQERGDIPADEPFIWHFAFGYDPFIHARAFIEKTYKDGCCLSWVPDVLKVKSESSSSWSALAVVRLDEDQAIAGYARCHSINFPAPSARDLCEELAVLGAAKKLMKYRSGSFTPYTVGEIQEWREHMRRQAEV